MTINDRKPIKIIRHRIIEHDNELEMREPKKEFLQTSKDTSAHATTLLDSKNDPVVGENNEGSIEEIILACPKTTDQRFQFVGG